MIHNIPILKKLSTLLLAVFLMVGMSVEVMGQVVIAEDDASNYGTWDSSTTTSNGFGFGNWSQEEDGENSGHFRRSSVTDVGADINSDGNAFGMFAHSGQTAASTIPFPRAMAEGDVFQFQIALNFLGGAKGFDLRNASNDGQLNFNAGNGADDYRIDSSTIFNRDGSNNTVLSFTFTQTATELQWEVVRSGEFSGTQTGSKSISPGTIQNIRFYNNNSGSSAGDNFFFNNFLFTVSSINNAPTGATVRLDGTVIETLSNDLTLASLEITENAEFSLDTHTLTLQGGGNLTEDGTFNANTGNVIFAGAGSVAGSKDVSFYDVEIAGGVVLRGSSTINNSLTINEGGYLSQTPGGDGIEVSVDVPTYGTGATLRFTGLFGDGGNPVSGFAGNVTDNPPNVTVLAGARLTMVNYQNISGDFVVESGGTLELAQAAHYEGQDITISGFGIQVGGIDQGALLHNISGTNRFTGAITLADDARINSNDGTFEIRGDLDLDGNTLYVGGSNSINMMAGSSLLGATKTDLDGAIFKDGSSFFRLRPSSNLTGNINLVEGEIRIDTGVSGIPSGGRFFMSGGTTLSTATATDRASAKDMMLSGNVSFATHSSGGLTISGNVDLGDDTRIITVGNNSIFSGVISNGGLTKDGSGILTLSGNNTYEDATTIENGTLRIEGDLSDQTDIRIASAGNLDVQSNITVNSVGEVGTGNGGTINLGTGISLTIAGDYSGTLFQNSISGAGSLVKNGAGILGLYGTQSFEGTTSINGGTLRIQPSTSFPNSSITVASDAYLISEGTIGQNIVVNQNIGNDFDPNDSDNPTQAEIDEAEGQEGWRFISAPVSTNLASLLGSVWTQGATDSDHPASGQPNVYRFDDTQAENEEYVKVETLGDATIGNGEAYAVYLFARDAWNDDTSLNWPKVLNVTGSYNGSNVTPSESTFNQTAGNGFNLVGNPFSSPIQFSVIDRGDAVRDQVFIYDYSYDGLGGGDDEAAADPPGGGWRTLSGTIGSLEGGRIAPFQGFFVRNVETPTETPSITIQTSAKTTEGTSLFNTPEVDPHFRILARINNTHFSDVWVGFNETSTIGVHDLDLISLFPLDYRPFLSAFIEAGNESFDIKYLPTELAEPVSMPFHIYGWQPNGSSTSPGYIPMGGNVELFWPKFENIPANWTVTITDNITGAEIDLRNAESYEFELDATKSDLFLEHKLALRSPEITEKTNSRFTLTINPTTTSAPINGELPQVMALSQNYPNPFNPTTQISYDLPQSADVRLDVFNIQGQRVATLVNAAQNAGTHNVTFDARNLASGVYIYRLQAGATVLTKKMTLVK